VHTHKQHAELMILQADPEERGRLLARLAPGRAAELRFAMRLFEDIDLATAPAATEFSYLPASRRLTALVFWASAFCGAGLLVPVIRGRVIDQTSAALLIGFAALFLLSAFGYKLGHQRAGVKLRVDSDGLTAVNPDGTTHIPWNKLTGVRYRRWAGVLEYTSTGDERIEVSMTLIDFAHFVQLTLIHQYRTSLRGAA
jgi:hypothetical protein